MNDPAARRPTALLADDEPHLMRALAAELSALWPELQIVHQARQGLEAAERIAALQPDLAFLDIQMPGLTGLEVAQGIEGGTRIVFVTAYDEHAVAAFEHEALDYVLKPVSRERLERTVQRLQKALAAKAMSSPRALGDVDAHLLSALQRLLPGTRGRGTASEPLRWVRASSGEFTHQVSVEEVLFFHADDKYTCVRTVDGAEHLIRTTIQELSQSLDPQVFVQVHRSTIVNLRHLAGTRRDEASRLFLRIKGHGSELPVSRAYVHLFRAM
ncbi:MAG: response regulator transcription factor [Rubrivivax sp.]|nr:response regulator transcription factor [Rubrivivax sp.]